MVSLAVFAVILGATLKSFWRQHASFGGGPPRIALDHGYITFDEMSGVTATDRSDLRALGYISGDLKMMAPNHRGLLGFSETKSVAIFLKGYTLVLINFTVPLWFPLVLLLIAPVRWLIARPENAPAFAVVTKQP